MKFTIRFVTFAQYNRVLTIVLVLLSVKPVSLRFWQDRAVVRSLLSLQTAL